MVPIPSERGRPTVGFDRVGGGVGGPSWAHEEEGLSAVSAVIFHAQKSVGLKYLSIFNHHKTYIFALGRTCPSRKSNF